MLDLSEDFHKPGIYFGLPESVYHADPSLSKSGICSLLESPETYWWNSWMNPNRAPEEDRSPIERGKLWHCRLLERDDFDLRYMKAKTRSEFEADGIAVLDTVSNMKEYLERCGEDFKKSAAKPLLSEWCSPVAEKRGDAIIWETYVNQMKDRDDGKTVIWSDQVWDDMLFAETVMQSHPYFSKVFHGGMSEVSIFWRDGQTGLPLRCRIDKLKATSILDYKTLGVRRGVSIDKAALQAIKYEKYDLQAAMYTVGVAMAVNMINDGTGVIEGDVDGAFIDDLRRTVEKPFGFVFQQADRPCAIRGRSLSRTGSDMFTAFGNGILSMQEGIRLYQDYRERYGERMWQDPRGMEEILEHEIYYG